MSRDELISRAKWMMDSLRSRGFAPQGGTVAGDLSVASTLGELLAEVERLQKERKRAADEREWCLSQIYNAALRAGSTVGPPDPPHGVEPDGHWMDELNRCIDALKGKNQPYTLRLEGVIDTAIAAMDEGDTEELGDHELHRKLCSVMEASDTLKQRLAEVERLEGENKELRNIHRDAYLAEGGWIYQGDADDKLESLTCPVVIQPKQLREIIAERDARGELLDKLKEHTGAGWWHGVMEEYDTLQQRLAEAEGERDAWKQRSREHVNLIGDIYQVLRGPDLRVNGNELEAAKVVKADRDRLASENERMREALQRIADGVGEPADDTDAAYVAQQALASHPTAEQEGGQEERDYTTDPRHKMSDAALDAIHERQRQMDAEGWTLAHDDLHTNGELWRAALCYIENQSADADAPAEWPWSYEWWKPKGRRTNLIRAIALLIAEVERIDRLESSRPTVEQDEPDLWECPRCFGETSHDECPVCGYPNADQQGEGEVPEGYRVSGGAGQWLADTELPLARGYIRGDGTENGGGLHYHPTRAAAIAACWAHKRRQEATCKESLQVGQPKHDGDCHIYAALDNGQTTNGICTCGAGLKYLRATGDDYHLVSKEHHGEQATPAKPAPPEGPFYDLQGNQYRLKYDEPRRPMKGERWLGPYSKRIVLGPLDYADMLRDDLWIVEPIPDEQPTRSSVLTPRSDGHPSAMTFPLPFEGDPENRRAFDAGLIASPKDVKPGDVVICLRGAPLIGGCVYPWKKYDGSYDGVRFIVRRIDGNGSVATVEFLTDHPPFHRGQTHRLDLEKWKVCILGHIQPLPDAERARVLREAAEHFGRCTLACLTPSIVKTNLEIMAARAAAEAGQEGE